MRIRAIDWVRGLVMMLMTIDHAGNVLDSAHLHGDMAARWIPGSPLPTGEFLTRWITHLCAPTFVLLAGVSLALSAEKRRDQPGQTRFIVTRGLLIAMLDPLWMSLAFSGYDRIILQVLYAIGLAMVCMAGLRRLPTAVLLSAAVLLQLLGELSTSWQPTAEPWHVLWTLLFTAGPLVGGKVIVGYPLLQCSRPALSVLSLFGATAFFYYLLHAHLLAGAQYVLRLDTTEHGLAQTWIGAAFALAVLAYPCWLYRRYKAAHPDGWTRYI
jgi:uncharacterized membrane protein